MAIDYGNYAQIYGGQGANALTPLRQGVQNYIAKSDASRQKAVGRLNDEIWSDLLAPYQRAVSNDVTKWTQNSFSGLDAGTALLKFKQKARAKGDSFYNEAAAQGLFNPITFKQQYDQMRASYMPNIEAKVEQYKLSNGLNDRQMQMFLSTNPHLRDFLLDHANPAGTVREWAKPYVPKGFFGGAVSEVSSEPFRYGMSLGGASAIKGAWGGAKDWKDFKGMGKGAAAGLKGNYAFMNPLKGEFGKRGVPSLDSIAKDLKKTGYGAEYDKGAKHAKKRWNQKVGGAKTSRNKAFKKATGQAWSDKAKGKAKSLQTKWSNADKWKGVDGAGGKSKTRKLNILDKKAGKAKARVGQGALKGIQGILQKHGKAKVISTLAKKLGWKAAAKVAGKLIVGTALTGTGVGTVAGVAMNAWTLYDIYNILSEAFQETGGVRSLDKMAFGGAETTPGASELTL